MYANAPTTFAVHVASCTAACGTMYVAPSTGGVVYATIDNSGDATFNLSAGTFPTAGTYSATFVYPGNANFQAASVAISLNVVANPNPATSVTATPPSPVYANAPTTFAAHVSPCTAACGTMYVAPSAGGIAYGAINNSGDATFNLSAGFFPVAGTYSATFTYPGNASFQASSTSVNFNVLANPNPATSITVTPPSQVYANVATTFVVHVSSCTAACGTMYVHPSTGGAVYGAINNSGDATFNLGGGTFPTPGTYSATFVYPGNASFQASSTSISVTAVAVSHPGILYSYSIVDQNGNSGYDPDGNVVAYTDTVNGQWTAVYDNLNRLTSAWQSSTTTQFPTPWGNAMQQFLCWQYDSFGNRLAQVSSSSAFANLGSCSAAGSATTSISSVNVNPNNQVTNLNYTYDGNGNLTGDGQYMYQYDGAGRLCAVRKNVTGMTIGYLYDGDGNRVAKGNINPQTGNWCDLATNGFTLTSRNVLGLDGQTLTEFDSTGASHSNISLADGVAATLTATTTTQTATHLHFTDWLGTRRVQTDAEGNAEQVCSGGAFGDSLSCTGQDAAPNHFTGKERDAESELDYFGARYYASSMGRFMSPDWSAKEDPVPYAKLDDPQTLNLYSYVRNNPLSQVDPDGHCCLLEDIDKVVKPLVDSAEGALSELGGGASVAGSTRWGLLAGPAIFLGAMIHPATVSAGDKPEEEHQAEPEPQVSTSGAGARQGGGKAYDNTPENQDRMAQGKPPIGTDGHPVELHHTDQTTNGGTQEMTRTDHRLGGNYVANHSNTGQQQSQVDRNKAAQQRREHWKNQSTDKKDNQQQ
jgi:RHS repeat-associated protein